MNLPLLCVVIAATSIGSAITCRAEDPLEFTFFLTDSEGLQWTLLRYGNDVLFRGRKRPRRATDMEGTHNGGGTIKLYIEPAGGGEPVPLRRNHPIEDLVAGGPYVLSMEKLLDRPQGYLTADYATDPPTVRLEKTPGKDAQWTFVDAGKFSQAFVKHEGDADKPVWLSLADSGFVRPTVPENGQEMVLEYRLPILSAEKKHRIYVSRHTESR